MTRPRVAVLDDYEGLALASADWSVLEGRCEVDVIDRKLAVPDEAARVLAPYAVLCHLRERTAMPAALIEQLPQLRFMTVTGRAHRTLDLAAATRCGVLVSHVSHDQEGSQATPELAWGLILAAARRIVSADASIRRGAWDTTPGILLEGKTLGLLGLGRIGQSMARIGQAFGMRVIAWSQNLTPEQAAVCGAEWVPREALFRQSDVLSIHLVLSDRSRRTVDTQELSWMKPEAILVNTSRGPIVNEAALVEALAQRRIGAAGLDVFEQEPLPAAHPLRGLDNVVLTPHVGYVTRDSLANFYRATVAGLQAYFQGSPIKLLNPEALASPGRSATSASAG